MGRFNLLPLWVQEIIKEIVDTDRYRHISEKNLTLNAMFLWGMSPEGFYVWHEVEKGNYTPLADFHKINPTTGEVLTDIQE